MKPESIILVRHGESEGNVDKNIYTARPDYSLYLTENGKKQADSVGRELKSVIGRESVGIYYSPFFRARQTMEIATKHLDHISFKREEVRIREQEWSAGLRKGSSAEIEEERDQFGHFYYRFDGGEACSDVFDRISDYIGSLNREFEKDSFPKNVIIFGHGMTNRLFLMRWLHKTVEEFEKWANPKNCEFWTLLKNEDNRYDLLQDIRKHELKHSYQYNPK